MCGAGAVHIVCAVLLGVQLISKRLSTRLVQSCVDQLCRFVYCFRVGRTVEFVPIMSSM